MDFRDIFRVGTFIRYLGPVNELELPDTPADRWRVLQKLTKERYSLVRMTWVAIFRNVPAIGSLVIRHAPAELLLKAARNIVEEVAQNDRAPLVADK